jgi:hypothetical protein
MRAAPRIENWMAGLDPGDRVVTCAIVRGEILLGRQAYRAGFLTASECEMHGTLFHVLHIQ